MNVLGSGFISIINYASGDATAIEASFEILTENNNDLLTELSQELLLQSAP